MTTTAPGREPPATGVRPAPVPDPAPLAESPAELFRTVAKRRTNGALKQMALLEETADTARYEYTDEQVSTIITSLRNAVDRLQAAYLSRPNSEVSL